MKNIINIIILLFISHSYSQSRDGVYEWKLANLYTYNYTVYDDEVIVEMINHQFGDDSSYVEYKIVNNKLYKPNEFPWGYVWGFFDGNTLYKCDGQQSRDPRKSDCNVVPKIE